MPDAPRSSWARTEGGAPLRPPEGATPEATNALDWLLQGERSPQALGAPHTGKRPCLEHRSCPPPPVPAAGPGAPEPQCTPGAPEQVGGAQALTALIIPLLGKYRSNDDGPGPVLGTGDSV